MHFNVLEEPWIPVRTVDGGYLKLGLREFFEKAPVLSGFDCSNYMEEYSLYRFLALFLSCVYRFNSVEDIIDLFEQGKTDMGKFEDYICLCNSEGISFDMFDDEKPFLQYWDVSSDKISNVACITALTPSGNNSVHFNHTYEKDYCIPVDKALRLLVSSYVFTVVGGRGKRPGPNGSRLPMFFVPKGKNLFETLVFSMRHSCFNCSEKQLEVWRSLNLFKVDEKILVLLVCSSPLLGTMFPSRMIRFIPPDRDGLIRKCYYLPGLAIDYSGEINAGWRDYYSAYYVNEDGNTVPLRPELERAPWIHMDTIYAQAFVDGDRDISVLKQVASVMREEKINNLSLIMFGLLNRKAEHIDIRRGEIDFYSSIAESAEKTAFVEKAVGHVESVRYVLYKTMTKAINIVFSKGPKKRSPLINRYIGYFYGYCEPEFYLFLQRLSESSGKDGSILEDWDKKVKMLALKTFEDFCSREISVVEDYFSVEKNKGFLIKELNGFGEGGNKSVAGTAKKRRKKQDRIAF